MTKIKNVKRRICNQFEGQFVRGNTCDRRHSIETHFDFIRGILMKGRQHVETEETETPV